MRPDEVHAMYQVCAAMAHQIRVLDLQLQHVMGCCERYLKTDDDEPTAEGCQHPEDRRAVSMGMGGDSPKWICLDCTKEFEGSPSSPVKCEEPA